MSDTRRATALRWLRLVALCPLAAVGLEWTEALLLGAVSALALLVVDAGLFALRSRSTTDQQPIIAAVLAAIAVGSCDLLLQTFCHAHSQALQPFLPLPIVVAVLFCRIEPAHRWQAVPIAALSRGSAFTVALLIGALLHAALPFEAAIAASLILSGLLLAISERSMPRMASGEASTSTPRVRARVTGPLR